MHVVIDTNIIVSAYLGGSLKIIIQAFKAGKFTLLVSKTIVDEYFKVLARPKFKIERTELDDFASLLVSKAKLVTPSESLHVIKADPSDNMFLEAALAGGAIYIVSGDNHLLDLQNFYGIEIIAAGEFISRLK